MLAETRESIPGAGALSGEFAMDLKWGGYRALAERSRAEVELRPEAGLVRQQRHRAQAVPDAANLGASATRGGTGCA
ncbi:hypothetical protein OHA69_40160 [Streptomyces anulatus]|uniref:hypothetical protein n=1 Tax=Streptomyces anulatus TaxID=1892 RepID=UPI00225C114F|nr:hypothetical protein [Streptomyces anulatus]MCX4523675.1 hypothetical protein [Streptomyces anulatus]MCX4523804.1 hypothetical protein [Streptomyces anulatus]